MRRRFRRASQAVWLTFALVAFFAPAPAAATGTILTAESDLFLALPAGGLLDVRVNSNRSCSEPGADPMVWLYRVADGAEVGSDDDGGHDPGSQCLASWLAVNLEPGEYRIRAGYYPQQRGVGFEGGLLDVVIAGAETSTGTTSSVAETTTTVEATTSSSTSSVPATVPDTTLWDTTTDETTTTAGTTTVATSISTSTSTTSSSSTTEPAPLPTSTLPASSTTVTVPLTAVSTTPDTVAESTVVSTVATTTVPPVATTATVTAETASTTTLSTPISSVPTTLPASSPETTTTATTAPTVPPTTEPAADGEIGPNTTSSTTTTIPAAIVDVDDPDLVAAFEAVSDGIIGPGDVALIAATDFDDAPPKVVAAIVEALNAADDDTKRLFEEQVDVFAGAFDDYTPAGSNVSVATRRTIIAVTTLVASPLAPTFSGNSRRR